MARKNTSQSPEGKPVKIGRIGDIKWVKNQDPHRAASKVYATGRLQMPDGTEVAGLWTPGELERFLRAGTSRAAQQPNDLPVADGIVRRVMDLVD